MFGADTTVIIAVLALAVLFGLVKSEKIPEFFRNLGKAKNEYEEAKEGDLAEETSKDIEEIENDLKELKQKEEA